MLWRRSVWALLASRIWADVVMRRNILTQLHTEIIRTCLHTPRTQKTAIRNDLFHFASSSRILYPVSTGSGAGPRRVITGGATGGVDPAAVIGAGGGANARAMV